MKRIIVSLLGQSNTRGRRWEGSTGPGLPTISHAGPVNADPIGPNGGDAGPTVSNNGSLWPRLTDRLFLERDISLRVRNTAHGATGLLNHWNGRDASWIADDPMTDPNSYISDMLDNALMGIGFDERWVFIQTNAPNDAIQSGWASIADRPFQSDYEIALTNVIEACLANGIKVALGLTALPAPAAYPHNFWRDVADPAVKQILVNYASNSNVIAGANFYDSWGYWDQDGTNGYTYDGSHWSPEVYDKAADIWFDALVNGGW